MARAKRIQALWLDRTIVSGPYLALCTTKPLFRDCVKRLGCKTKIKFVVADSHARVHYFTGKGLTCVVCIDAKRAADYTGIQIASLLDDRPIRDHGRTLP